LFDAVYESDPNSKDIRGEPLGPLTGTGNQGGFRYCGSIARPHLVILYTSFDEPDWPDHLDREYGLFTYYGDNRKPG
jgi:Restriction endonuclease AspBHI N-terminal